jgi:hypothetical protein
VTKDTLVHPSHREGRQFVYNQDRANAKTCIANHQVAQKSPDAGATYTIRRGMHRLGDAVFKIKYDKRLESPAVFHRGSPPYGPPDHDLYVQTLQREFEEHLKIMHPDEYAARHSI